MTYRFLSPAAREVAEAARYYEERAPGLGFEFISEVRAAIHWIQAHSQAWCPLDDQFPTVPNVPIPLWHHLRS
jgi:hypothetical protein